MEQGFARGAASPCSFCAKERGIRVVVRGKDFFFWRPKIATGMAGKRYGQALRGEADCDGRVKKS